MNEPNSQTFLAYADKVLKDSDFKTKTEMASNDVEMIKIVKTFFNWTPPTLNNKFKKSSAKSMKYAEEAIEAGNARQIGRSLKLANMITAFAEDAGDLALGHVIRYMLIPVIDDQKFKELEFCSKSPQLPKRMNANITLTNNSGKKCSPNFYTARQMKKIANRTRVQMKSPDNKKLAEDLEKTKDKKRNFTRDLFTLKSPNPKAPALEDFVEIKYDSIKGRKLIVTKDVPGGTVLMLEKPIVAGLGNVFDLEIRHCHHCFKKHFIPIPCPNCVFVLYCSEKCLEESKDFHNKYECAAYPDICFLNVRPDWQCLCAYLTVCTYGPHQLFQAFQKEQKQSPLKKSDGFCEIDGVDPETGIYDSSSLYTISRMTRLNQKCCTTIEALSGLALTRILELRTDFFEQLESELKSPIVKTQFIDFITLLLIKIQSSHGLTTVGEPKYFDEPRKGATINTVSLQATYKLANHSCQENFGFCQTSNLKGVGAAYMASRDLKKGEELFRNFEAGEYFDKPKHLRQAKLMKGFHFKCECVACLNDWPLMEKLRAEADRRQFCCPLCSSKIPPEPKMMSKENYEKITLNSGNNFICPQCKFAYKKQELLAQFKRFKMALRIAENLIEEYEGEETLESLKAASTFFQNHLIPPSYYQEKCRYLLPKAITNSKFDIYDE